MDDQNIDREGGTIKRATIFVMYPDDVPSEEFLVAQAWFERWKGGVAIANEESGGWEILWDVEAPEEAISELPVNLLCTSDWSRSQPGK